MRRFINLPAMDRAEREAIVGRALAKALPGANVFTNDLAQALAEAQADFQVVTRPMAVLQPSVEGGPAEGTWVPFEGKLATTRGDNHRPLGIVSPRYEVVQTLDALAPVARLAAAGELALRNVHLVRGGEQVGVIGVLGAHAVAQLPGGGEDVVAHLVDFTADHTGGACNRADLYSLRLICTNGSTSRSLLRGVRIRHCSNALEATEEAARTIGLLRAEAEQEAEAFSAMAETPLSAPDFVMLANDVLNDVRGTKNGELQGKDEEKRLQELDELLGFFQHGQGNRGATAWDGFNSFTEWLDHRKTKKSLAERYRAIAHGSATGDVKAVARRRLLALRTR